jgi:hypothetical protein
LKRNAIQAEGESGTPEAPNCFYPKEVSASLPFHPYPQNLQRFEKIIDHPLKTKDLPYPLGKPLEYPSLMFLEY